MIVDHNGHPVPDGTPVDFHLRYPTESLALAPRSGNHNRRTGAHVVSRWIGPGELWITANVRRGDEFDTHRAESGWRYAWQHRDRSSDRNLPAVGHAHAAATPTPTPTPRQRQALVAYSLPQPCACRRNRAWLSRPFLRADRRVPGGRHGFHRAQARGLAGGQPQQLGRGAVGRLMGGGRSLGRLPALSLGWLPGVDTLQAIRGCVWAAGVVTFVGGALSLLWTWAKTRSLKVSGAGSIGDKTVTRTAGRGRSSTVTTQPSVMRRGSAPGLRLGR